MAVLSMTADPAAVPPLPVLSAPPAAVPQVALARQDLTGAIAARNTRLREAQMSRDAANLGRITDEEDDVLTRLRDLIDLALDATPDARQCLRVRVRETVAETGRRLAALDRRTGQAEQWAEDHGFAELRRLKHQSEGWFGCPGGPDV